MPGCGSDWFHSLVIWIFFASCPRRELYSPIRAESRTKRLCWGSHALLFGIARKGQLRSSEALTSWRGRIRKGLSANLTGRTILDGKRPGLPATGMETRPNESSKYCSMIFVVSDLWLHLAGGSSLGQKSEVKAPPRTVRMQAELYRGRDPAWDEYVSAHPAATFFREWNSGKNFPSFARWALVPMRRGQWRDSSESLSLGRGFRRCERTPDKETTD